MPEKKKRFTLDLEPELQMRLKIAAARKGISMRRYCLDAIEKELEQDTEVVGSFSVESLLQMTKLRDEIFGGKTLSEDSAVLIREAREERSRQL